MTAHSEKAKSLQRVNRIIKRLVSIRDARPEGAAPSDLQLELHNELEREWRAYKKAVITEIAGDLPLIY